MVPPESSAEGNPVVKADQNVEVHFEVEPAFEAEPVVVAFAEAEPVVEPEIAASAEPVAFAVAGLVASEAEPASAGNLAVAFAENHPAEEAPVEHPAAEMKPVGSCCSVPCSAFEAEAVEAAVEAVTALPGYVMTYPWKAYSFSFPYLLFLKHRSQPFC